MKCGLCLVVKIENDECSEEVLNLRWVQFILKHINIDYNEALKACQDCSKRLKEIHNFCEFVEQSQVAEAIKLKEASTAIIEADSFEITEIKLEYFSENEENIIEPIQWDDDQVPDLINKQEDTQKCTNGQNIRFLDSSDVRSFIGKNTDGNTKCVYCNKTCKSVHALTCHIALNHYERKNICKICSKEFPYKRELYRHVVEKHKKTTTPAKSENCTICQKSFENETSLRLHVARVHKEGYSCDICGTSFSNKDNLKLHLKNAHNGNADVAIEDINDRTCIICNEVYNSFTILRYHVYQVHRHETPYPCKACNLKFRFNYLLRQHFTEVHSQPNPNTCSLEDRHCIICNISFRTHKSLKNHMEIFHKGKRPFSCGKCFKKFSLRTSLRHHFSEVCMKRGKAENKKVKKQKKNKEDTPSSNTSRTQSPAFNTENNAEIVLTESTDEILFESHINDKTNSTEEKDKNAFKAVENQNLQVGIKTEKSSELCENESRQWSPDSMNNIQSTQDNDSGTDPLDLNERTIRENSFKKNSAKKTYKREMVNKDDLFCCICDKSYESLSGLQGHMYTKHKDEQPFACEKCGRTFRFQHKLRKHKCSGCSDEEDRLDRTCSICFKFFSTVGSLREHMYNRHKNEKPLSCGSCGLTFRFHDKFRKHLAEVHPKLQDDDTDDRTCIICNISYKSVHILRQHMHTRHKSVKPFDCDSCGKSYNMKVSLKRHIQKCQVFQKESSSQDDDVKDRTCFSCNKVYKCVKTLGLHIYQCHYEETFYGDSCDN